MRRGDVTTLKLCSFFPLEDGSTCNKMAAYAWVSWKFEVFLIIFAQNRRITWLYRDIYQISRINKHSFWWIWNNLVTACILTGIVLLLSPTAAAHRAVNFRPVVENTPHEVFSENSICFYYLITQISPGFLTNFMPWKLRGPSSTYCVRLFEIKLLPFYFCKISPWCFIDL